MTQPNFNKMTKTEILDYLDVFAGSEDGNLKIIDFIVGKEDEDDMAREMHDEVEEKKIYDFKQQDREKLVETILKSEKFEDRAKDYLRSYLYKLPKDILAHQLYLLSWIDTDIERDLTDSDPFYVPTFLEYAQNLNIKDLRI